MKHLRCAVQQRKGRAGNPYAALVRGRLPWPHHLGADQLTAEDRILEIAAVFKALIKHARGR